VNEEDSFSQEFYISMRHYRFTYIIDAN